MITPEPIEGRPVIFGEVLYDQFPDGTAVLGGAPFNVAWHLQGFGCNPLFISRIGGDDAGRQVRSTMQKWGMDAIGLQTDAQYPTGAVEIRFSGAQHSFDILADQAYDHIDTELAGQSINRGEASFIYHGSLIIRTEATRQGLDNLLTKLQIPVFLDINLRQPWWREDDWPVLFNRAKWVKVNDEELALIAERMGIGGGDLEESALRFQADYKLDLLVVTRGEHGAFALDLHERRLAVAPRHDTEIVDTVGAGDAFSSVILLGLVRGWPLEVILQRAQDFASRVCSCRGATSEDAPMYQSFLDAWRGAS